MLNFTKRVVQAWTTDNVISSTAFQGPQPLLSQLNLTWLIWLSLSLYLSTIQAPAGCRHCNSFPSISSL